MEIIQSGLGNFDFEKQYWEQRYFSGMNSGAGSRGEEVEFKIDHLKGLYFKTVLDIGCGDGYFYERLKLKFPNVKYTGLDLSQSVIEREHSSGTWKVIENWDFDDTADLVLCIDVLFHIINEDDYQRVIEKLKNIKCKYLVISQYNNEHLSNAGHHSSPHVSHRVFDADELGKHETFVIPQDNGIKNLYIYDKTN